MKLENQVSNLELSKKLKELGVEQESLFYHHNYSLTAYGWSEWNYIDKKWFISDETYKYELNTSDDHCKEHPKEAEEYSAFSVAELGEDIPSEFLNLIKKDEVGRLRWNIKDYICYETTEANSRAKMLIYLIENKELLKTNE